MTELPPADIRESWQVFKTGLPRGLLAELVPIRSVVAECDYRGNFEFLDLPEGDYELHVKAPNHRQVEGREVSLFGDSISGLRLDVVAAGVLKLKVAGLPRSFSAAIVAQILDYGNSPQGSSVTIFRNGEFEFSDGPLGGSVLRISSFGDEVEAVLAEFPLYLVEGHPSLIEWDASL